jgi:hypothetical protein
VSVVVSHERSGILERAQELFAEAIAAGPSSVARSDVGLVIGPFRLAEQIGQGGMGCGLSRGAR